LRLLGFDSGAAVRLDEFTVTPRRVAIGGEVTIDLTLVADTATRVVVDYVVHHAGAQRARAPKVFKLTTRTVEPGAPQRIVKRHAFREVSVRRLYPGAHRVEVQVNGRVLGGADVELYR
jgi:hypothetical protein